MTGYFTAFVWLMFIPAGVLSALLLLPLPRFVSRN
jgi:hypothetical protein